MALQRPRHVLGAAVDSRHAVNNYNSPSNLQPWHAPFFHWTQTKPGRRVGICIRRQGHIDKTTITTGTALYKLGIIVAKWLSTCLIHGVWGSNLDKYVCFRCGNFQGNYGVDWLMGSIRSVGKFEGIFKASVGKLYDWAHVLKYCQV